MVIKMKQEKNNEIDLLKKITNEKVCELIDKLPSKIRFFRKNNKLSQEQFAINTCISRKTVQRIEKNETNISLIIFLKILLRYPEIITYEEILDLQNKIDDAYDQELKTNKESNS